MVKRSAPLGGSGDAANEEIIDPGAIEDREDASEVERLCFGISHGSRVRPSRRATSASSRKASTVAFEFRTRPSQVVDWCEQIAGSSARVDRLSPQPPSALTTWLIKASAHSRVESAR